MIIFWSFKIQIRLGSPGLLAKSTMVLMQCSGGSKGGGAWPPLGPNSFNFMQFLGKFAKIVCWRPPGELAPRPRGNPGSATAMVEMLVMIEKNGGGSELKF